MLETARFSQVKLHRLPRARTQFRSSDLAQETPRNSDGSPACQRLQALVGGEGSPPERLEQAHLGPEQRARRAEEVARRKAANRPVVHRTADPDLPPAARLVHGGIEAPIRRETQDRIVLLKRRRRPGVALQELEIEDQQSGAGV